MPPMLIRYSQLYGLRATAVETIKNYPKFWEGKGKGIYLFPKFCKRFSTDNQKEKRPRDSGVFKIVKRIVFLFFV